jgi:hypothetical protein
MQDQVADPIGLDGPAKQPAIGKDCALAFELLQAARSHPIGQRRQPAAVLFSLKGKEILAQWNWGDASVSTQCGCSCDGDDAFVKMCLQSANCLTLVRKIRAEIRRTR